MVQEASLEKRELGNSVHLGASDHRAKRRQKSGEAQHVAELQTSSDEAQCDSFKSFTSQLYGFANHRGSTPLLQPFGTHRAKAVVEPGKRGQE